MFLAILPPTLERSQVTSVRKYMKAQLITLLRHPRGPDYYDSITTLLTDLGATFHEVNNLTKARRTDKCQSIHLTIYIMFAS